MPAIGAGGKKARATAGLLMNAGKFQYFGPFQHVSARFSQR
jgi:hypothetical protein